MLTIRPEQMAVLEAESWRRLGLRAEAHLRRYFPEECAALGEQELSAGVERAIRRARRHGLEFISDYLRYVNLALLFGWNFDEECPWAAEILARKEFPPHPRLDLLCQKALEYLPEEDTELEGGEAAVEEEPVVNDLLEDETMGESLDGDAPEPLQWEPEEPAPAAELDPDVDYEAYKADFHDDGE